MKHIVLLLLIPITLLGQPCSNLQLSKIKDSIYIYTTFKSFDKHLVDSHGLVVQTSAGLVLIDTPWDDTLTTVLLDSIRTLFNQPISLVIVTHAHDDRIGGIATLHRRGIKVVSISHTCQKARELGFEVPEQVPTNTTFIIGNEQIELFYPGPGHTVDNSIVWLNKRKILFGGCMVKALPSHDLGNIAEANLKEWSLSIQTLLKKYPSAHVVIPGHGTWGDKGLLQHTLDLLEAREEKK